MVDLNKKNINKDQSYSFSSEDTKDDSGDYKLKCFQSFSPEKNQDARLIVQKAKTKVSTKIKEKKEFQVNQNYDPNSFSFQERDKKKETGKFSLLELKKSKDFSFKEVRNNNCSENCGYSFVQDLKGPIYYSKGKSGATFIAKISKVVSKINRNVFDKGMKYLYRVPKDVPEIKFWNQRFYYYSKFDEGIKMDYESWYSVTPEDLSYYISLLAGKDSVCIDPFAGSGGNVIQFSKNCAKVYAVDIDPVKIEILKNNCEVYKCPNNIEIYHHDFLTLDHPIKVIIYNLPYFIF